LPGSGRKSILKGVNDITESYWGSPSRRAERTEAMTVDPLHLIQIMLAQGSGCKQKSCLCLRMCIGPPFLPGKVGFLHAFVRWGGISGVAGEQRVYPGFAA
jgi:hypothetical protein